MLEFITTFFKNLWDAVLKMFGFRQQESLTKPDAFQIFVRTNMGEQVCVSLDPSWTIGKVKSNLCEKLNSPAEDLRIIFAGKELPDDLVIRQCDLGNRSILHAVRVISPNKDKDESHLNDKSEVKRNHSSQDMAVELPGSFKEVSSFDLAKEDFKKNETPIVDDKVATPTLLCDPSTVMTIQLSDEELNQINQIKAEAGDQMRPHFYVYCVNPCASVQIGKLRVRCSKCKDGALMVHKDPCSWSDVLIQHQISSTCETPGCGGTYAEFYFKCCQHQTTGIDDTAVPLYLVRSNLPGVPCLACTDISSPIIVFECSSAHIMCLDCFITYCVSRLNERQFMSDKTIGYTLPCPIGCPDSLIKEVHHFKLMGDQQYDRYQRFGAEEAVLAAGGVLCPQPGCGQGIIPDEDCRRVACIGGCGYVFCKDCLQGYHIGECHSEETQGAESCLGRGFSFDPERAAQSRWEDPSKLAIRVLTKPCPKCRTATERDGGCMHMVCTRATCQFHWCWVCQTEWTRECMAAHWFG